MGAGGYKALKILGIIFRVFLISSVVMFSTPVLMYLCPQIMNAVVIENHGRANTSMDPQKLGLSGMNFYLNGPSSLIPVWHLWPKTQNFSSVEEARAELGKNETKLFVYFHGTALSRLERSPAFVQMINAGWHIIVPEFKGWVDAAGSYSGHQAVYDSLTIHEWLRSVVRGKKIFWWCFSMGTGVCTTVATRIRSEGPDAILLEAPFEDLASTIEDRLLYQMQVGWIPVLGKAISDRFLRIKGEEFPVKKNLLKLPHIPLLHVHAEDDLTVEYKSFTNIRDAVKADKKRTAPYFPVSIPKCRNLNHYPISGGVAPDMVKIIEHFWEEIHFPGIHTQIGYNISSSVENATEASTEESSSMSTVLTTSASTEETTTTVEVTTAKTTEAETTTATTEGITVKSEEITVIAETSTEETTTAEEDKEEKKGDEEDD